MAKGNHKLTYWMCECFDDGPAYNIRAKTKAEALRLRALTVEGDTDVKAAYRFSLPYKVTAEYSDAFDLIDECLSENRGWWEKGAPDDCDLRRKYRGEEA